MNRLVLLSIVIAIFMINSSLAILPSATSYAKSKETAPDSLSPNWVPPKTLWFDQTLDHFNYKSTPQTFKQRVLVAEKYFKGDNPVIFFYSGNEGDIGMFYNNTGFMFDIAPEFNALIVFAEHRYYGESMPFGQDSFKGDNTGFLSMPQVLADYAGVLTELQHTYGNGKKLPVVTFGGSYGGMLSAWFRLKYPHIVDGAIAASAPVLAFTGMCNPEEFNTIITNDFASVNANCAGAIHESWKLIESLANTMFGRNTLTEAFQLCEPIQSPADATKLINFLVQGFTYEAMTAYPYPSDFLQPMPGFPVNVSCSYIKSMDTSDPLNFLKQISQAVGVYYNSTGQHACFNTSEDISGGLGDAAWDYQACTEMVMPISADSKEDFFPAAPWDLASYTKGCQKSWGVTPRPYWIELFLGGTDISAGSNIVFSNGELDPWRYGGFTRNITDSLVAVVIKGGAHHLDLRASNPLDPPSVIQARNFHKENIRNWIAHANYGSEEEE